MVVVASEVVGGSLVEVGYIRALVVAGVVADADAPVVAAVFVGEGRGLTRSGKGLEHHTVTHGLLLPPCHCLRPDCSKKECCGLWRWWLP